MKYGEYYTNVSLLVNKRCAFSATPFLLRHFPEGYNDRVIDTFSKADNGTKMWTFIYTDSFQLNAVNSAECLLVEIRVSITL